MAATPPEIPSPPDRLGESGRALWGAVLEDYDLDTHELTVLREACRTADSLEDLQQLLEAEGLTSGSSQGVRVHPALVELRLQRVTFARLLTALRIPSGDTSAEPGVRDQPRGGVRGVYGLPGVS
jgi:hypothetical protein